MDGGSKPETRHDAPRALLRHGVGHDAIEPSARGGQAVDALVVNIGVIDTTMPMAVGTDLEQGGFLVNARTIEATGDGGVGARLVARGTASTVVINAGTIIGALDGIDLASGGLAINAPGALIDGRSGDGIAVSGAPGTILEAGTIAVSLAPSPSPAASLTA